jgi:Ulp1 family protease
MPWNKKRKFSTTIIHENKAFNLICQTNKKLDNNNNSNPAFDTNITTDNLLNLETYKHTFSELAVTPEKKLQDILKNPKAQPSSNQFNNIALNLTPENESNTIAIIRYSDIYRFRINTCISSNVVNYFFQLLQLNYGNETKNIFLPSTFASTLYAEVNTCCKEEQTPNWDKLLSWNLNNKEAFNPFEYKTIYVPICIANIHWCLATIAIDQTTIFIYDSLVYDNAARLWYNRIIEYLSKASDFFNEEFDKCQWNVTQLKQNQKQPNGYTSGLFTCWYAHCLATDKFTRTTCAASRYIDVAERKMSRINTNIHLSIVANRILLP